MLLNSKQPFRCITGEKLYQREKRKIQITCTLVRIAPIEIIEVNAPPVAQAMSFKGQLISERNFGVFKSPKKRAKFLNDFCPSI